MASIARCSLRAAVRLAPARRAPLAARLPVRSLSTTRMLLRRKYSTDHEWIEVSADGKTGVIGISEYAAQQLGDAVYVELPQTSGDWADQGDAIGAVESVKSASDINAPVRCRVTHSNPLLEQTPLTVTQLSEDDSPGGGWIARVELDDESTKQLDGLMDADAYKAHTAE